MPRRGRTSRKWAIYDRYSNKLKGGFKDEEAARDWYAKFPPTDILDESGVLQGRVASAFEADLILQVHPGWTKKVAPLTTFVFAHDY